jgi:hypothetical protein
MEYGSSYDIRFKVSIGRELVFLVPCIEASFDEKSITQAGAALKQAIVTFRGVVGSRAVDQRSTRRKFGSLRRNRPLSWRRWQQ